ncbi:hypothetical protein SADUNF_Sadunf01G0143900 [Salix dunnii]|uniref:Phospholipase/carboxylesterase/thioesterase domain-containing protein n=1 Tax=Salix dunnii TaxID=1413687 RepID=A0A835NC51_9ROSI|nr:hypothetical protein SADUNF_Sadunf01G0143900 [Salix dunnii]
MESFYRSQYLFAKFSHISSQECLLSFRSLRSKVERSHEAARRAASLPLFLCHGTSDDVVPYNYGEKSAHCLNTAGFRNLTFKSYEGLGHYTVPGEMDEARNWLTARLGLEGSRF